MKKLISVLLAVMMIISMTTVAMAENGGFKGTLNVSGPNAAI